MESREIMVKSKKNKKIEIGIIPGHFATNHSHINYYINMTEVKCVAKASEAAAEALAAKYVNNTAVDTIICMDGCEVIGGFLAQKLSQSGVNSLNSNCGISVVTPEYNTNGQMIFRDNLSPMIWNKKVLLLVASATTGKTINRSLECIKYYGGHVTGISAIFSAIDSICGIEIDSIFNQKDISDYKTFATKDCPDCKAGKRIEAIVNSYGYSRF